LTWKLVSFFHNCVMFYAQWYIWNEMKFSNWNSYMADIKIFENRECSMTICEPCSQRSIFAEQNSIFSLFKCNILLFFKFPIEWIKMEITIRKRQFLTQILT
jgi:hypothetical protein